MKARLSNLVGDLLSAKFLKYLLNAIITYPLVVLLTYCLTEYIGIYYLAAYLLSMSVAVVFNFMLSLKWIFDARGRVGSRFVRYLAVLASFTLANTFLVKVFTEYIGLHYVVSITVVSGTLFILKYLTYKKKVFA
ncbi:MAG: GtrA family protein [Candidatus Altiarchaeota archaeon]